MLVVASDVKDDFQPAEQAHLLTQLLMNKDVVLSRSRPVSRHFCYRHCSRGVATRAVSYRLTRRQVNATREVLHAPSGGPDTVDKTNRQANRHAICNSLCELNSRPPMTVCHGTRV